MVKHDLRFLMFWVLAVLLIMVIMRMHIIGYAWDRAAQDIEQKRNEYKVEVSSEELEDFIRLYPKFKDLNLDSDDLSVKVEENFSLNHLLASVWLFYRRWDFGRFYYVKDRILSVMQALEVQRYSQAVINVLSDQKDEVSREMIKLQEKHLEAEKVDPKEAALIQSKESELKELLK